MRVLKLTNTVAKLFILHRAICYHYAVLCSTAVTLTEMHLYTKSTVTKLNALNDLVLLTFQQFRITSVFITGAYMD